MRKGLSSSVKALLEKTGWTLKPSPTQCLGAAGRICLTVRRDDIVLVDRACMIGMIAIMVAS